MIPCGSNLSLILVAIYFCLSKIKYIHIFKVDSEELAAEVLEEVRHLHLDQGLVVDLDDPEVALRLIFP